MSLQVMTKEEIKDALWGCIYAVRHVDNCLQAIAELPNNNRDQAELIDGLIDLASEILRPSGRQAALSEGGDTLDNRLQSIELSYRRLLEEQNAFPTDFPALSEGEAAVVRAVLAVLKMPDRSRATDEIVQLCRVAVREGTAACADEEVSKSGAGGGR